MDLPLVIGVESRAIRCVTIPGLELRVKVIGHDILAP